MVRPLLVLSLVASSASLAQNLRVIPVPWSGLDVSIPHQAYNGHATTFKAIARGGNGTYLYEWDFTGDGTYDFSATTSNRYNLSTRFTYPNVASDTELNATVRVTSNGQAVVATYRVRLFADVPTDPSVATDRQLQVMRNVAIDDGLWFLHNQMTRSGNEEDPLTGAQATGSVPVTSYTNLVTPSFLEALGRNQHFAAFPSAYLGTMPDPAANAQRWAQDPYAEDAMRLVNYLMTQTAVVGVAPADEVNLTGFYPEVTAPPIPGTDDGLGLYIGYSFGEQTTGPCANALRGLAVARLTGYVAQTGDSNRILGRRFEHIVQQFVDALVWAQNEAGLPGSWYYTPNSGADMLGEFAGGVIEVEEALWLAEQMMKSSGVIVPNFAKARLIEYIRGNANFCPRGGTGGTYTSSANGVCDFALSAAHTFALGWVDANQFSPVDARIAFPSYSGTTRGQLRALYDSSQVFIGNVFLSTSPGQNNWDTGFVEAGNFGRIDGLGNHWSMLHWARAARAVEPEIVNYGTNNWARLFSRYLINNQGPTGGWNWVFSGAINPHSDNILQAQGRAAWALLVLSPDEVAPVVWSTASLTTAAEGTRITFTAVATAPGAVTWTFGNGDSATGASVDYTFPDNGSFSVTAFVGMGASVTQVTITNAPPVANAGADLTIDEGSTVDFSAGVTDPGTADTHTFSWAFGDGQVAATRTASHAYPENGTFNVVLTVNDDDLGIGTDGATLTVRNVAPLITSTPPASASAGSAYAYTVTFTDPGPSDTHTCSAMTAPAGAMLTGCALSWTPAAGQAGAPQAFILCVTDDDTGRTCQSFTVTPSVVDTDADGLPDSWELMHFAGLGQTGSGDPDLDGVSNLAELQAGTNPSIFDGPSAPTVPMPLCDMVVATARATLIVTNATDPQMTPLTYEFEVYDDAALTSLVASATVFPGPGPSQTTQWRASLTLQENIRYYWRARARDQSVAGPWSTPVCSFIDGTNSTPGAPRLDSPSNGAQVSSLTPTLTVGNAVDPEGDVLTYEFEVFKGTMRVANQAGIAAGTGTTSWQVTPALTEDTEYSWHARAVSAGGAGPFSATGTFRVNMSSSAPVAPVLVSPQNGVTVDSTSPLLVFLPSSDADGDALVYDWELAADEGFATALASGMDVTVTQVMPATALSEDTRYCWRVRADDGQAQSAWSRACFTVSTTDAAPGVPTLINPSNGSVVETLASVFSWASASDPEGGTVRYDLELSEGGTVIATLQDLGGNTAVIATPLTDGRKYAWRVRAKSGVGPSSEYSAASSFDVKLRVTGGSPGPCGCGASPGWMLAPLALALLRRRRRQRESAATKSNSSFTSAGVTSCTPSRTVRLAGHFTSSSMPCSRFIVGS